LLEITVVVQLLAALDIDLIELMKIRTGNRFDGPEKPVFRKADALVRIVLQQVSHHVIEALLVLRTRTNLEIQKETDDLALRVIRNRVAICIIAPQPRIPTRFLQRSEERRVGQKD